MSSSTTPARLLLLCLLAVGLASALAPAPAGAEAVNAIKSVAEPGYRRLGTVAPRHAREIKSSNWSIGAEVMDRDYTVYKNWCEGVRSKACRFMARWC